MSIRPDPVARQTGYPRTSAPEPAATRLAAEEPVAFRHEHARLYGALETAAQLAELAGHDGMAASLRRHRRHVAAEFADGACGRRLDPADGDLLTAIALLGEAEALDGG